MGKACKTNDSDTSDYNAASLLAERLRNEGLDGLKASARLGGLLRVSIWTLVRLCLSGELEAIKVSGRWLTSAPAIARFLTRQAAKTLARTDAPPRNDSSPTAAAHYLDSIGLSRKPDPGRKARSVDGTGPTS